MRFAVTIYGEDGQTKYDPRYVKMTAVIRENGVLSHFLPLHNCTDEDMAQFYPLEETSNDLIEKMEKSTNKDVKDLFLCLDWSEEIIVKPNYASNL